MDERTLIITATLLMLIVVIPVIVMTPGVRLEVPRLEHPGRVQAGLAPPNRIGGGLAGALRDHRDPRLDHLGKHPQARPVPSAGPEVKPVTIQAVSLDWKWLFIYPEQGIATVNEIAFPKDTPVNFQITSDSVMNSFFIPQLGSQIYRWPG